MPIISKETWDKFTQKEKEEILKDYQDLLSDNGYWSEEFTPEERSGVIQQTEWLFGKEALQPQPLTYEDVARELFKEKKGFYIRSDSRIDEMIFDQQYKVWLQTNNCTSQKQAEKLLAINKLLNVAKFLNKDWKPDWEKLEEKKWYPSLSDGEIKISYVMRDSSSPVYFRTEELAEQAIQILGEDTVRLALDPNY